jgi:hypothetical protein
MGDWAEQGDCANAEWSFLIRMLIVVRQAVEHTSAEHRVPESAIEPALALLSHVAVRMTELTTWRSGDEAAPPAQTDPLKSTAAEHIGRTDIDPVETDPPSGTIDRPTDVLDGQPGAQGRTLINGSHAGDVAPNVLDQVIEGLELAASAPAGEVELQRSANRNARVQLRAWRARSRP